jgi:hypothetical protein
MRKILRYETVMWTSLFRWVRHRRPMDQPGTVTFGYGASAVPLMWAFIVLSVVELIAVDLLLHRWLVVRLVADVLGLYGLIWMVGLLAILRMHPHTVAPDELILRSSAFVEVRVPRDDIQDVRLHRRYYTATGRVQVDGATVSLVGHSQTQVEVRLRTPMTVADTEVTEIRVAVDDPAGFVAAVQRQPATHIR